jgi:TolB-like protein/tetratricopeptide (TPR) repeat protein
MSLVSELKRRNVFRIAALYIVAAWLIMQVTEVLMSLGNLPEWVGPATLAILAIGFPIALVFSWIYEITPEGIALERDVERGESITQLTGRRMDFIVIALLSAALLVFAWDKWRVPEAPARSIAILPFENQGPANEEVAFLATGIQDGLLTRLSQFGSLKVISRTSADRYRGSSKSVSQIGAELGVRALVEGAVQRSGGQIRVNVQLIDAETDEHIWADNYDRSLTASNLFTLQSEIVETIARQLDAKLAPAGPDESPRMPTQNLSAYTEYLRGIRNADIESVDSLNAAISNFSKATELDPDFALAYVGLADAYLTLGAYFFGGLKVDESVALAEPPLMHALELDGTLVEAQASLGMLRQQQGDWQAAEQAYDRAIALRPNYARVFRLYGRLRWGQGRTDEALQYMQQALRLDPYSVPINFDVARLDEELGRFEEALARYLRIVEVEPSHAFAHVYIAAIHYLVYGRADESLVWYREAAKNDPSSPSLQAAQALAYLELGDPDSARKWVERGLELGPDTFWALWSSALLNLYVGDDEAAARDARTLLEYYPRNWGSLRILRDADIAAGRLEVARSRYARLFPELFEPELPAVDDRNYFAAIDLALVLILLGEERRADDILAGSLAVIATKPRLGTGGYWVNDARIHAIQQRPEQALDALREAVDAGWRLHTWYYLDLDPNLEPIRGTPEFAAIDAIVEADLARQAERVRELEASGELGGAAGTGAVPSRGTLPIAAGGAGQT